MSQGTVKWFNSLKGFGFIQQDDGSDVFVHANSINSEPDEEPLPLNEGDRVEFEVLEGNKGPMAGNVTRLGA